MLVYPPIQHSPSCQDSKIPRFESWNLGNLGRNLGKNPFTPAPTSCYIGSKPRGPVRKNTTDSAFATPNDKRGFVMPKFFGLVHQLALAHDLRGKVGAIRKDVRMAESMFLTTLLHQLRVRTLKVVPLTHSGAKTMSTISLASRRAAYTSPTGTSDPIQLHADAHNALNMAVFYLRQPLPDTAAARRKAIQALTALRGLSIALEG